MTRDPAALKTLLARVQGAAGPDNGLDLDIAWELCPSLVGYNQDEEPYCRSWLSGNTDAALTLVERLLPLRDHDLTRLSGRHRFGLSLPGADRFATLATGATAPLAILAALLTALLAQPEGTETK